MTGAAGGPSCPLSWRFGQRVAALQRVAVGRAWGSSYRWGPCSVLSWGAVEATAVCPVLASVARAPLPVVDCGSLRARWTRVRGTCPGSGSPWCASRRVRSRTYAVGGGGGGSFEQSPRSAHRGCPVGHAPGSRSTPSTRRLLNRSYIHGLAYQSVHRYGFSPPAFCQFSVTHCRGQRYATQIC